MEIHQLRYFVAIADAGNFTRASERCSVTQPSLSQQIINLERELGHKLFHRLGRRAVLTEAGQAFLERSRRILFEVEDATKEIKDSPAFERHIKIGAIPTLAPYLLPPLLERCAKLHPNLQVHIHEDFRPDLLRGVLEGDLDLAIVPQPVKNPHVSVEPILKEPLLLVTGRDHPLATKPEISARDLADEDFVLLGHSSTLAAEIQRFCGDHNFVPRLRHRCSQVATVKTLVALGKGISILPKFARNPEDSDALVYRELSGRAPNRDIVVIRHLQRYQTKGAEFFLGVLRRYAADFAALDKTGGKSSALADARPDARPSGA